MATLEKIRSKSVLLVVIIAVALLAFILGDLITNGRNLFGNDTTVAKVGKEKVDYMEMQRKQQELSAQMNGNNGEYSQILPQMALTQVVYEKLMNKAVEALDFKPIRNSEVLKYYMMETPLMQNELMPILQEMAQSGMQFNSIPEAHALLFSGSQSNPRIENLRSRWVAVEAMTSDRVKDLVFMNVLSNSFQANDLDIAAMRRDKAATASVEFANKPFFGQDLAKYEVSDEEIKKQYDADKNKYAVKEPTKELSFIAYSVRPSAKDRETADKLANQAVKELKEGSVSADLTKNGAQYSKQRPTDVKSVSDSRVRTFLETAPVDSVILFNSGMGFTVAKLNSRENTGDSIGTVNVAYELVEYTLQPSESTMEEERQRLEEFLSKNNTAQAFVDSANFAGYTPQYVQVSASTPAISMPFNPNNYYPNTRSVVRWAMIDGDKGSVSKVYDNHDYNNPVLYAAAVVDTYDDYQPWNSPMVKETLADKARKQKAGQEMAKQYKGNDINEVAEVMGVTVMPVEALTAGTQMGLDQKVKGRILGSKASPKVQTAVGENGVVSYVITNVATNDVPDTDEALAQQFMSQHQLNPLNMLLGNKKIESNIYKFEAGE